MPRSKDQASQTAYLRPSTVDPLAHLSLSPSQFVSPPAAMANLFRRIYDWLLRLFWYARRRMLPGHRPACALNHDAGPNADAFHSTGLPRWTSP